MSSWPGLGDELRAARGTSLGGARREPEATVGRLGAGRAGVTPGRMRPASMSDQIRAAWEEQRGLRGGEHMIPAFELFGRRR